ncbi:Histone acetyltransferase HAC1 [Camellia lanceoleosa]|uniref:Histone acetyltransferase HAC1 n=1 Tax=Camellia lanceoleosa TaxID=1840588 RepID=A0ACC0J6P7_9ERIC|nr:Histone acetyltransferase HAC1 [Camellia lanceoleosa]
MNSMMDVNAYKFIQNVSHQPQMHEMGLHQGSLQEGDSIDALYKESKMRCAKDFLRNKIAKNLNQNTNLQLGELTSDRVLDLQSQLSVNGASKEYMNQKMLACQLQNMIQHEIRDGSFSSQQVACHATSSFGNLNSPHALIDCSTFISTDCSLRTNSANDSSFFNDGSFGFSKGSSCGDYNQGVATAFMAFDGARMLSPAGIRQVSSEMVPSSEQLSSITVCSDTDVYSNAVPFDDGPTFRGNGLQHLSGLLSENNIPQQHLNEREMNVIKHGRFLENNQNVYTVGVSSLLGGNLELPFPNFQNLQQDRQMIPEASGILTRAIFDTPMSTCEDLLQPKLLMPGTQLFHQPHQQPYVQFDESSEDQSRNSLFEDDECINKITGKKAFNVSSLPSKQSHGVQYVALESSSILLGPTGAAKPAHSSDLMFRFLLSYMNYKTTHVDGSQVSFIKHMHSTVCNDCTCNCDQYFMFLSHFDNCHCWECNICRLVRRSCVTGKPPQRSGKQENGRLNAFCDNDFSCTSPHPSEDIQHPSKRLKMGNHVSFEIGVSDVVACSMTQPCEPQQLPHLQQWPEACASDNLDATKVNMEVSTPLWESTSTSSTGNNVTETAQMSNLKSIPIHPQELICCSKEEETVPTCTSEVRNNVADNFRIFNSCSVSVPSEELTADHKEEKKEVRTKSDKAKLEAKSDFIALSADSGMKSVEPKILGESLINSFTVEEMKEHLSSLRQFIGQEMKGNTKAHSVGEKSCQLCSMDKLVFAPAPIYCSSCGARIKLNLIYHCALDKMGTQHCFCNSCFKGSHGREISFHGISISKAKFHKERINHEDEESWVQCDKCRGWQHQICALYNDKSNLGGKSEYVCPKCYLEGIEVGEHVPLPKTVAFGAKDLPTTTLSDYIEQRLFRCLMQDSEERAKALQKKLDEVPRAANLAVRVVLSVKKLLKVKQQFLDIFHNEKYPTEFPYRSKVILLFQRIEGVDVCLFGMYVQEYGSECSHPNQRCVYISYLDSVKYFRPEIKTASGEALRTFVYHQILIGYLDYCKKRGFATCYIWACPPVRGEDYILYCHPETQKTPKSDKLRQWYKSMLRKAIKENIVVDCTNLYDHFFVPTGEHNMKITAARLPYFDGDYLSGAAVDMIKNIEQRSQVSSQSKVKKALTKRTLKAMGHTSLSDDATKDILLMKKLEQTISPVKEDFIMVHLQFTCTCCHEVILSGSQWICNECKNFQLCARCHDVEQTLNEGNTHTSSSGEKHSLSQVVVKDVPVNTEDTDVIIDNGYFENRHSFLSFCQANHYQFDTLRHVKHSSMMILYHLHNPTKQSVGTSCCICHQDIVVNQGWHCEICPRFDACDGCYHRKGDDCHIHKLSQCSSIVNCGSKNGQTQQQKSTQMREILDVLMHASQCNVTKSSICSYPNCILVRRLFHHSHQCNLRFAGGCLTCQKTWMLLALHSKDCRDCNCRVPRCMDLKKHAEMLAL